MTRPLTMWTVYDRPSDAPEYYVARLWHIAPGQPHPTSTVIASSNLEIVRDYLLELGLTQLPRTEEDDPVILECWL